ncbi:MAG TPA: PIG-L family deacetylase [Rhodocyclaceae bacterium]
MRLSPSAPAFGDGGPVLVVSPHLDDAVMSCGCLIATLSRRRAVTVATLFAGRPRGAPPALTEWDRAAGFAPGRDAVGARRGEDRAALAVLGAEHRWLPFADSQYGDSPRSAAIARRIDALTAARLPWDAVVFPLGLFHSDHRLAHEAVLLLLRRTPSCRNWIAYEDVPYRRLPGLAEAALRRLRRAGLAPRGARISADGAARRRKARALACYRSQLTALATPGRLGHADAWTEEGYWLLRAPSNGGRPR